MSTKAAAAADHTVCPEATCQLQLSLMWFMVRTWHGCDYTCVPVQVIMMMVIAEQGQGSIFLANLSKLCCAITCRADGADCSSFRWPMNQQGQRPCVMSITCAGCPVQADGWCEHSQVVPHPKVE